MSACPHCGTENDPTSKRCQKCALPLDSRAPLDGTLRGFATTPSASGAPPQTSPGAGSVAPNTGTVRSGVPAPDTGGARMDRTLSGMGSGQPSAMRFSHTLAGVSADKLAAPGAPPASSSSGGPPATLPGGMGRTLSGISPLAVPQRGATPERTLIGSFAQAPAGTPPARDVTVPGLANTGGPSTLPGPGNAPFAAVPATRTALGLTQAAWFAPGAAPAQEPPLALGGAEGGAPVSLPVTAPAPAAEPSAVAESIAPAGTAPAKPSFGKTQLGVATPGIAPIHPPNPSAPAAEVARSVTAPQPAPPVAAAPAANPFDGTFAAEAPQARPAKAPVPRGALALLAAGALLLGAALAFAFLWRGNAPLSALVSVTEGGKERIDIVCETCPDGTSITLGGASAAVQSRKAYLDVESPLKVGENPLSFSLRYPDGSETSASLRLPVEYRITSDLAGLAADDPYVAIVVETLPRSAVTIAGSSVALDAAGRAEHRIVLGDANAGLNQSVPYAINTPAAHEYKGELKLNIGVTPLDLEAPGRHTVTDQADFVLAGRTAKDAKVTVAGSTLAVGADGRFVQSMRMEALGESTVSVRAQRESLAPRTLTFRVRRVNNLRQEAERLRPQALDLAAAMAAPTRSQDQLVSVRGNVEDSRIDGERTILLVEPAKGCSQNVCLARVIAGGKHELKAGSRVAALGYLTGKVETLGKGKSVAELEASLLEAN